MCTYLGSYYADSPWHGNVISSQRRQPIMSHCGIFWFHSVLWQVIRVDRSMRQVFFPGVKRMRDSMDCDILSYWDDALNFTKSNLVILSNILLLVTKILFIRKGQWFLSLSGREQRFLWQIGSVLVKYFMTSKHYLLDCTFMKLYKLEKTATPLWTSHM